MTNSENFDPTEHISSLLPTEPPIINQADVSEAVPIKYEPITKELIQKVPALKGSAGIYLYSESPHNPFTGAEFLAYEANPVEIRNRVSRQLGRIREGIGKGWYAKDNLPTAKLLDQRYVDLLSRVDTEPDFVEEIIKVGARHEEIHATQQNRFGIDTATDAIWEVVNDASYPETLRKEAFNNVVRISILAEAQAYLQSIASPRVTTEVAAASILESIHSGMNYVEYFAVDGDLTYIQESDYGSIYTPESPTHEQAWLLIFSMNPNLLNELESSNQSSRAYEIKTNCRSQIKNGFKRFVEDPQQFVTELNSSEFKLKLDQQLEKLVKEVNSTLDTLKEDA